MKKQIEIRGSLGSILLVYPKKAHRDLWLLVQDHPTLWTRAGLRRLANRLLAATESDPQKGKR